MEFREIQHAGLVVIASPWSPEPLMGLGYCVNRALNPLLLGPVPLLCECLVVPAHQNPVDLRIALSDLQSLLRTRRTRNSGWSR